MFASLTRPLESQIDYAAFLSVTLYNPHVINALAEVSLHRCLYVSID